jgi:hypothetical protein
MRIGFEFRNELSGIPGGFWIVQQFDRLLAGISGVWKVEHNDDGTHGNIRVQSIRFPSTPVASENVNTLDDYEEGTWTPTDVSGAGLSLATSGCAYVKVGELVYVTARLVYPVTADGSAARVGGLPFTCASGTATHGGSPGYTTDTTAFTILVQDSDTYLNFYRLGGAAVTNANFSGIDIRLGLSYRATP